VNAKELFVEYMETGRLLQLATVHGSQPWICHVWYAWDASNGAVIFMSRRTRRHCQELAENPLVAGAVVAIPLEGLGQKVTGAMFEGHAAPVPGDNLRDAYDLYATRWPQVQRLTPMSSLDESGTDGPWFYAIEVGQAVLFDEVNFPDSPRQEFSFRK
jgi:uncharacterized protein YhbP (UPF0306 family)